MSSSSLSIIDDLLGSLNPSSPPASSSRSASSASSERAPILLLFDVDGTLSKSRLKAEQFMWDLLDEAKTKLYIGIVGGSDYVKQQEQLERKNVEIKDYFDYVFSENGLVAYGNGKSLNDHSLKKELGETDLKIFINFCLKYLSTLELPIKRGTFLEFRTGMINVSPIGRNCSQQEREDFFKFDSEKRIRERMIETFQQEVPDLAKKLKCSIGGQISFDVFPHGWDKTYCLQFVEKLGFKEIHFFGDKTYEGGNDYEIFEDPRTIGHAVKSPVDTVKFVREILDRL